MALQEVPVFIFVSSVVGCAVNAGLVRLDESHRVVTGEPLDHVKFVIVLVVVLFTLLGLDEVEIILGAVASPGNCPFKLTHSLLGVVEQDAFTEVVGEVIKSVRLFLVLQSIYLPGVSVALVVY